MNGQWYPIKFTPCLSERENTVLQWAFIFISASISLSAGSRTWHLKGHVLKVEDDVSYMLRAYIMICICYYVWGS
jgi:hypothetical protein